MCIFSVRSITSRFHRCALGLLAGRFRRCAAGLLKLAWKIEFCVIERRHTVFETSSALFHEVEEQGSDDASASSERVFVIDAGWLVSPGGSLIDMF